MLFKAHFYNSQAQTVFLPRPHIHFFVLKEQCNKNNEPRLYAGCLDYFHLIVEGSFVTNFSTKKWPNRPPPFPDLKKNYMHGYITAATEKTVEMRPKTVLRVNI